MDVTVSNTVTRTDFKYEGVKDMGSLLELVRTELGPGVVKRPSPTHAPGTGATVATGASLVPGQKLEWYPAATAGAGAGPSSAAGGGTAGAARILTPAALGDHAAALARALLAPFREEIVPHTVGDGSELKALLSTPPNLNLSHAIPSHQPGLQRLFLGATGGAGQGADVQSLMQLHYTDLLQLPLFRDLVSAAECDMYSTALGTSEVSWVSWWDVLLRPLVKMAQLLDMPIRVDRGVEDPSISIDDKRRDFLLWAHEVLVVGGEHKRRGAPLPRAELVSKHKGVNASLYGKLGYILLLATSGPSLQMFALPVNADVQNIQATPVTDVLNAEAHGSSRASTLRALLNTFRLVRTVLSCGWLGATPSMRLFVPHQRPSPHGPECGTVQVTINMNHVVKAYAVPPAFLSQLKQVYGVLQQNTLPHAIRVLEFTTQEAANPVAVYVKLTPVGARTEPRNTEQLRSLAESMLQLLVQLHAHGLVHRDIRSANVVRAGGEWVLIDWELAGAAGQPLPFDIARVPEPVRSRVRPYTFKDDLWQLGQMLRQHQELACSDAPPVVGQFIGQLQDGSFEGSAAALLALQTLPWQ